MTKMAAMHIYGKNPSKIFFTWTAGGYPRIWFVASGTSAIIVFTNDDPGMTLTYFTARSNLVTYAFLWKKGKTVDFSELLQPVT